jgi:hypothetical protein
MLLDSAMIDSLDLDDVFEQKGARLSVVLAYHAWYRYCC